MTVSINHVLAYLSLNTRFESNTEKASYDKLIDIKMEAFAGVVKRFFERGGHRFFFCFK